MSLPRVSPYVMPVREDLPAARVPWQIDRSRAAILIHDMQAYFARVYDPLVSPMADAITNITRLRQAAAAVDVPVFYTAQPGDQDPRDRGLQRHFWGAGMRSLPDDQSIVEALAPASSDIVLTKWRYSAFARTTLLEMLRARGRDQLIVTGVFASIGCQVSAVDAFVNDIEPFFVADAVADLSRDHHWGAMDYVAWRCGVVLLTRDAEEALRG